MKKLVLSLLTVTGFCFLAQADDFDSSQEHLRNSPGYSESYRRAEDSSSSDFQRSQRHLRGGDSRYQTEYRSCMEADFGSEFWWECRRLGLRN